MFIASSRNPEAHLEVSNRQAAPARFQREPEGEQALDSLSGQFHAQFQLLIADTEELRQEVHRIRYQVYCQELQFEREEDCPGGLERDAYDKRAVHCLLKHRASDSYAGCVRLVLCDPSDPEAVLPFENACLFGLPEASRALLKSLPRDSFGEVSRLAVTAAFRKRQDESRTSHGTTEPTQGDVSDDRRRFPLIALGLYLAATGIGIELGLDSVFTMMEPRLARHLQRFGLKFTQIGDVIDYHGKRGPFQVEREAVLKGLNAQMQELLASIRAELCPMLSDYQCRTIPATV